MIDRDLNQEWITIHVLGAVDSDDQDHVRVALTSEDPQVIKKIKDLSDVSAMLGYIAEPVTPPEDLESLIVGGLDELPPIDNSDSPTGSVDNLQTPGSAGSNGSTAAATSAKPGATVVNSWRGVAITFFVLLLAMAGATLLYMQKIQERITELEYRVEVGDKLAKQLQQQNAVQQKWLKLYQADDQQQYAMSGLEIVPEATGTVLMSPDNGIAGLVVEQLPPATPGNAYLLWLLRDNNAVPIGRLVLTENHKHSALFSLDVNTANMRSILVTLEADSDHVTPSGQMYMMGSLN